MDDFWHQKWSQDICLSKNEISWFLCMINMLGSVHCIFWPTLQDTKPILNFLERGQPCQFIGFFWVGLLGLAKNDQHFFDKGGL